MQQQLLHTITKNFLRAGGITVCLVLVIFIIFPIFNMHPKRTPAKVTYVRIHEIKQAVEAFAKQNGPITVTSNKQIIDILSEREKGTGLPTFINVPPEWLDLKGNVVDAWGVPLEFRFGQNDHVMIVLSYGPNKKHDKSKNDDISAIIQMIQPTPTTRSVNLSTNTAQHILSPTNMIHKDAKSR